MINWNSKRGKKMVYGLDKEVCPTKLMNDEASNQR